MKYIHIVNWKTVKKLHQIASYCKNSGFWPYEITHTKNFINRQLWFYLPLSYGPRGFEWSWCPGGSGHPVKVWKRGHHTRSGQCVAPPKCTNSADSDPTALVHRKTARLLGNRADLLPTFYEPVFPIVHHLSHSENPSVLQDVFTSGLTYDGDPVFRHTHWKW